MPYNTYMKIELTKNSDQIIMFVNLNDESMQHHVDVRNKMYSAGSLPTSEDLAVLMSNLDRDIAAWKRAINVCTAELEKIPYVMRGGHDTWHWPIDKLEEAEAFITYVNIKSAR